MQSLPRTRYGVMAHNLARWATRIGLDEHMVTTKTLRRRFFSLAGRLTRSARRLTPASTQALALGNPVQSRPGPTASHFHSQPDSGRLQPARQPHPPATPTSPKTRARPASERLLLVLSRTGELHMTVANRSPAPTVQNLPDNRSSMSLISRSATHTFGGFGFGYGL